VARGSLSSGRSLQSRCHRNLQLTMKSLFLCITVWAATALAPLSHAQQAFPVTTLSIGIHLIKAEVAVSDVQRAQGLMFREKMAPGEGMVFRFPEIRHICMWMKNTLLPLSVAFIDEKGRIINIEDMQPQTLNAHCAKKPARYALEMNQGWFKQKNIRPGIQVTGLPP
jgi:uncharacterized membrane protein (UPF0127 family)